MSVHRHLVGQIVDAEMSTIMQFVHVCKVILEHHHSVVQNVWLALNVNQHWHVLIKNVSIHVEERAD